MSVSSRKRPSETASLVSGGRRRRGLLDILPFLPLDVLCEIFSFLHPSDLLVLARTNRAFRSFLLKRSSAFIWRAARKNISVDGLPEPPSDMNEVQYASLVFGLTCYYEGCDGKARDIVWHLRIRSCAGCRSKYQPIKLNESDDYHSVRAMVSCFPDSLEQYIPSGPFLNSKGNSVKGFQEDHLKTFKDELAALPPSERQAYLDRRRRDTEVASTFASAGVAWQINAKTIRTNELRNKRAARAEIIKKGLIAIGFKEEIDYFGWDRICKHPLISNTQPITDQVRSTTLDQLGDYMAGWRELRMEEKLYALRRQVFVDAWFQFTTTAFHNAPAGCPHLPLPPTATIGLYEGIDSVIRQIDEVPHESLLGQFYAAFLPACDYILEWHRTVRRQLASLLLGYNVEDNDEAIHAQLRLATSVFYCNAGHNCRGEGRTLTYPEILFHPCFTHMIPGSRDSARDPLSMANQKACLAMGGSPWNCNGRAEVHPRQYVVNKVLLSCGKDPRSTTAAEMDKEDPRLACLECVIHVGKIAFMTWRHAVQHNITFHPNATISRPWLMASHSSRVQIDMLQCPNLRPFSSMSGYTVGDYSVCLHCPPRIPSWNTRFGFRDLMAHIKDKHGIVRPVFRTDYTFDTNITPVYLDPVIIDVSRRYELVEFILRVLASTPEYKCIVI